MTVRDRLWYEFTTPLLRIQELSVSEKAVSLLGGAAVYFWSHVFAFPFALMMVLSFLDWKLGTWVAVNTITPQGGTAYKEMRERLGLVTKVLGITLTLAVFSLEIWLYDALAGDVDLGIFAKGRGWAGTSVALAFVVIELKSINRKRKESGGPAIPVIDTVFGWFDWISGSMAPKKGPEIVKDDEDKVA